LDKVIETHDPQVMRAVKKKQRPLDQLSPFWNVMFHGIAGLFSCICVIPFVLILIISLTNEQSLLANGYKFIPEQWSFSAYQYTFRTGDQLLHSYGVTIFITVVGTMLTLILTSLYAYAIYRTAFKYRGLFSFIAFFTLIFSGGLVPSYFVMTQLLHLKNSILALILPLSLNAFNILILRTFFQTIVPDGMIESGKIDGASEFKVFTRLVLPISLPGLATIGLFSTLGYWNDWFNALLYIDSPKLVPLQAMLMKLENNMAFLIENSRLLQSGDSLELLKSLPQEATRMAMVILAVGPIIFAYPFFQRYFVQGLTIGSMKE
jgi:putative aldouronate transport system permease protein